MNYLFEKTLPAAIKNISSLRQPVLRCAREQGMADDKLIKLDLAMEEIMVNIVSYAYGEKPETGDIKVACGLTTVSGKSVFAVEITDSGRPFDVTKDAPHPDIESEIDSRQIGGLGIFLVKKTMDMMSYRRVKNKNILTIGIILPESKQNISKS